MSEQQKMRDEQFQEQSKRVGNGYRFIHAVSAKIKIAKKKKKNKKMLTIIFLDEEGKIDPEVLEALDWFWTEEYEEE